MASTQTKLVELLIDASPFGCKGDVYQASPTMIREMDALARRRSIQPIYKVITQAKD